MRYGIIGTGWITRSFIEGAKLTNQLQLTAVYSRSMQTAEAFANDYRDDSFLPAAFDNLEQMAKSDCLDAVYIASPNICHYEQSRLFLQCGKHVLCEKPATVTLRQMEELIALSERQNLVYMEAIMMLHQPARETILNALPRLGNITSAHFDFSQLSSKYPAYINGETPNIFNPALATGCLMDLGIYCVYPALDWFGEPVSILTSANFLRTGADGLGNSIWQYADKQIHLSYSKLGQSRLGSEILGDNGTLKIDSISKLTNVTFVSNDGEEDKLVGDIPKEVLMSCEADSFYRFVQGDRDGYDYARKLSLQTCRVMEQMRKQCGIIF